MASFGKTAERMKMKKVKADIRAKFSNVTRAFVSFGVLLMMCIAAGATLFVNERARAVTFAPSFAALTTAPIPNSEAADWGTYLHNISEHRDNCDKCHTRTNSITPSFPGHEACINCHGREFVTMNAPDANAPETKMCYICHKDLGSPRVMKGFPGLRKRGEAFNMLFTHAQHDAGAGRPASGCVFCHRPMGRAGFSIPVRFNAHAGCYTCHSAGKQFNGRSISACSTCHALAPYSRATTGAKSYRVGFLHSDHSVRQGMNCNSCHNIRTGVAQKNQVSSPEGEQHFANARAQTCMTCHNDKRVIGGKRVFGGDNFAACGRCHKGTTFSFAAR
jgi:hypothetical protein